ncbi:MAG: helicase-related protein, partial [Candidatus Diapherotrites archaeon]|nr:helicase-related protein [Candidatus Diapherotrites archaeon]
MDEVEKIMLSTANKEHNKNKNQVTQSEEIAAGVEEVKDEEADVFTSKSTDFVGIQKILEGQFHIGKKDSVQTLVFVNRIKKADLLNQMLAEKFSEKVSKSYHSKSEEYNTRNHFNDLKRQFAEGKFNVLISVGTLGEGIDFPYASHGIIASPIYNPTSFVQKVGRLLRSYKDHKKAVIYYYVPSELVTRLLTDERIEPNYFKSVIKIADENGDLYFVDRESLSEERGSLSELLIKGAAYERNEDIKRIKIPHDLDSIMRFFKRVYPENLKNWKKFYAKQIEESANKEEKNNKSNAFQDLTSINKNAFASKLKSNKQSITQILGENEKELALGEEIDDNQIVSEKEVVNKKPKEIDFTPLRIELSKNHAIMLRSAVNLLNNLRNISSIQKRFAGKRLSGFIGVKEFVKEGLKHQIITKIKYGGELESIAKESSSLPFSEQEMLCNAISAELNDFCVKQKQLAKALNTLSNAVAILEKYSKKQSKQKSQKSGVQNPDLDIKNKINGMNKISKTFFDLQSLFLDELDLADLSKSVTDTEKKFFLTIGKDIFLTKHLARKFSYPEDFGLSRWQEEKEPEVIVIQLSPIEKFAKRLMFLMSRGKDEREEDTSKDNSKDNSKENNNTTAGNKKSSTIKEIAPVNEEPSVCAIDDWDLLKKNICMDLKIKEPENEEVLKELERHKFEKEFSFEKLFFVTEAIKREKKKKTQV